MHVIEMEIGIVKYKIPRSPTSNLLFIVVLYKADIRLFVLFMLVLVLLRVVVSTGRNPNKVYSGVVNESCRILV